MSGDQFKCKLPIRYDKCILFLHFRPSLGQILMGKSPERRSSRCSLTEEFSGVEIIHDHYLSPLTAPKEILGKFPPCAILVSRTLCSIKIHCFG